MLILALSDTMAKTQLVIPKSQINWLSLLLKYIAL